MESIPNIRKIGKDIVLSKGFINPIQEDSSLFAYQELNFNRVCFSFSLKHIKDAISYSAASSFISNELGHAIDYITGEHHDVFPRSKLCSISWREKFNGLNSFKDIINSHVNAAIEHAQITSFEDRLNEILSTIDKPGSHQKWHIAALACTKNKHAIEDLLNKINTPNRGGLLPYIKESLLDLALQYVNKNT